jgi:hypothetical protein
MTRHGDEENQMRYRRLTGSLTGFARAASWDGNALRRPTDRIESVGVLAAVAMVLASIPVVLLLGFAVYQHDMAVSAQQSVSEQQVTATLLRNASPGTPAEGVHPTVRTAATWLSPSGSRTGVVPAPVGMSAGSAIPILIDTEGTPVDAPLGFGPSVAQGAVAAAIAVMAVAALLWAAVAVLRWRLNRSRYAAWADEWAGISPGWTQSAN